MIKKNLMIGNLQYAAEVALKCGRTTEALLIANAGGADLFEDIRERYFSMQKDPFVKVVLQSIVQESLPTLTSAETLRPANVSHFGPAINWQESLTYIFAYEENKAERDALIKELGDNLLQMKDISAAIVCYLISSAVGDVLSLWMKRAHYQIKKMSNEQSIQTKECILFDLFSRFVYLKFAL